MKQIKNLENHIFIINILSEIFNNPVQFYTLYSLIISKAKVIYKFMHAYVHTNHFLICCNDQLHGLYMAIVIIMWSWYVPWT